MPRAENQVRQETAAPGERRRRPQQEPAQRASHRRQEGEGRGRRQPGSRRGLRRGGGAARPRGGEAPKPPQCRGRAKEPPPQTSEQEVARSEKGGSVRERAPPCRSSLLATS